LNERRESELSKNLLCDLQSHLKASLLCDLSTGFGEALPFGYTIDDQSQMSPIRGIEGELSTSMSCGE
jgi:hypothetical protein